MIKTNLKSGFLGADTERILEMPLKRAPTDLQSACHCVHGWWVAQVRLDVHQRLSNQWLARLLMHRRDWLRIICRHGLIDNHDMQALLSNGSANMAIYQIGCQMRRAYPT